jgi:3-deoxy-D-manno-octulosonate 8-phosphate phosphatase (KDO 8-P phosphatase)
MIDHSTIAGLTIDQYKNDLIKKAKKIKLLAFDVDGVLTDGGLYYDHQGNESKKFHAQDGHGIKIIQSIDIQTMIISGRTSPCVDIRGNELGIDIVLQGSRDKLKSFHKQDVQFKADEICFVGDDTVDIELLKYVGLSVIVPNSNPILRKLDFDWITPRHGGNGAIRDVCDLIYLSKVHM